MAIRSLERPSEPDQIPQLHVVDASPDEAVPAIAMRNIRKTYPGGVEAVKGVSFEVARGEVFGLVGPNGAGKSTTIGILTSTVRPTEGTARLAGIDVSADPVEARKLSSVVFQEAVVDRLLTGEVNMMLHGRLWGLSASSARSRVHELAEAFGLAEVIGRPVSTYSGGQRRRLEIARALVSDPKILFLDEPTVGLDPRIRYELLDIIASLRQRSSVTILLTTHYLEEAERLCDRVAIMHDGEIVAAGSPSELISSLGEELVELRLNGNVGEALRRLHESGVAGADSYSVGSSITVPLRASPAAEVVASINRMGLPLVALGARRPTLDDVYLRLTARETAD